MTDTLLHVEDLRVEFPTRDASGTRCMLRAVQDISFEIAAGETLGIVGESGCGKSTLARALLRLVPIAGGRLCLDGRDYARDHERALRPVRRALRMVFQDPLASLNPRRTVLEAVREPLDIFEPERDRVEREREARAMLERVGLGSGFANRYPHELSGGQNQRASIARALVANPRLVICDESVSALDVSIQAQILNLLAELQRETGIALLFISHDLSVVRHVSRRVLVMYLGKAMEYREAAAIFAAPRHPYSRALFDAVPRPDPVIERERLRAGRALAAGDLPSPLAPPSGCVYRTRCVHADARCEQEVPALTRDTDGSAGAYACHHPLVAPRGEAATLTEGA
jgi:oligopeptide transport system ATP-binding protein